MARGKLGVQEGVAEVGMGRNDLVQSEVSGKVSSELEIGELS